MHWLVLAFAKAKATNALAIAALAIAASSNATANADRQAIRLLDCLGSRAHSGNRDRSDVALPANTAIRGAWLCGCTSDSNTVSLRLAGLALVSCIGAVVVAPCLGLRRLRRPPLLPCWRSGSSNCSSLASTQSNRRLRLTRLARAACL